VTWNILVLKCRVEGVEITGLVLVVLKERESSERESASQPEDIRRWGREK
jgi:hypothetical protein